MHETHSEEDLDRAMEEFLRATEGFITSWTEAVRRFGGGPPAMGMIRDHCEIPRRTSPSAFAMLPPEGVHQLWDREIDG